jgi:hypothetical protein
LNLFFCFLCALIHFCFLADPMSQLPTQI